MHDLPLITMLASALAVALLLGWTTQKFGLSPIVGYLLAGIVIGPYTPGFVADTHLAAQVSEIGVVLLMFGVGLHFRPQELSRVWRIAVPGAIVQSLFATIFGWQIAMFFGWNPISGLILGIGLSVASTVVLIRMLNEQGRLSSQEGHIAVGWLIVEDIFTILILIILPVLKTGTQGSLFIPLLISLAKISAFILIILILGPKIVSPIIEQMAKNRSAELFTLAIFVLAMSVAAIAAKIFDVSVALGAFLGGLVVAQSRVGEKAAADILPFRDVFIALFFVSVGMLFNPEFVVENISMSLAALAVVLLVKPIIAVLLIFLLRGTLTTALIVSIGLAQIGEFSFILATLARNLQLLPQAGFDLLVTCALISIALNPLFFKLVPYFEKIIVKKNNLLIQTSQKTNDEFLLNKKISCILMIGFGKIGQEISKKLIYEFDMVTIIDDDLNLVEKASYHGFKSYYGNAKCKHVLLAGGILNATHLFVSISSFQDKINICQIARELNKDITIICLAHSEDERKKLQEIEHLDIINLPEAVNASIRKYFN